MCPYRPFTMMFLDDQLKPTPLILMGNPDKIFSMRVTAGVKQLDV